MSADEIIRSNYLDLESKIDLILIKQERLEAHLIMRALPLEHYHAPHTVDPDPFP